MGDFGNATEVIRIVYRLTFRFHQEFGLMHFRVLQLYPAYCRLKPDMASEKCLPHSDIIAPALSNSRFSLQVRALPLPVRGMHTPREGEASLWPTQRPRAWQRQRRLVA